MSDTTPTGPRPKIVAKFTFYDNRDGTLTCKGWDRSGGRRTELQFVTTYEAIAALGETPLDGVADVIPDDLRELTGD